MDTDKPKARPPDEASSKQVAEETAAGPSDSLQGSQAAPKVCHTFLPTGRVETHISLGEFGSLAEGEQAAAMPLTVLKWLRSIEEIQGQSQSGTTSKAQIEKHSLEILIDNINLLYRHTRENYAGASDILSAYSRDLAKHWGLGEVFEQSNKWPGFDEAWDSWCKAMEAWIRKRSPVLGQSQRRSIPVRRWRENLFLSGIEMGGGDDAESYKSYADEIFQAAKCGDVEFFNRLTCLRRRKPKTGLLAEHVLFAWIAAALWTATAKACADFVFKKFNFSHGTAGSVRQARIDVGLWHERKPIIKGWTFVEGGKKLRQIKPVFYPTRLPRV